MPPNARLYGLMLFPLLSTGCLHAPIEKVVAAEKQQPFSVAFSPDGATLAVGLSSARGDPAGGVRFLDTDTLTVRKTIPTSFVVSGLTYSRDGKTILAQNYNMGPYKKSTGAPTAQYQASWLDPNCGVIPGLPKLSYSAWDPIVRSTDRKAMALVLPGEGIAGSASEWIIEVKPLFPTGGLSEPMRIPIPDKGTALALASERGPVGIAFGADPIQILALDPKRRPVDLTGHEQPILDLILTADGKRLISASAWDSSKAPEVIVWDVPNKCVHKRLPVPARSIHRIFLSEDGRRMGIEVCGENNGTDLTVWDVERGEKVHTSTGLYWHSTAGFSPDGLRLAVIDSAGDVKILDLPK